MNSLLSVKDVAKYLQVSEQQVRRLTRQGLPAIKMGNGKKSLWRFVPEKIESWLKIKEQETSRDYRL